MAARDNGLRKRPMSGSLKIQSLRSVFWAMGDSLGNAIISLGTFLVMARLLEPRDFGVVALAASFILLFNVVTGHTFADALVQAKSLDDDHRYTAFWSTMIIALTMAAACTAGAELIAGAVGEPDVARILGWLALVMPLNALGSVQAALLRRELRFREIAATSLGGRSVGALVGVTMAVLGFGAWSLVGQQIAGALAINVGIARIYPWIPRLRFSTLHFRQLAGFGFQVSASQLISSAAEQAVNLMVGTLYGSEILGFFNIAWRTVQLIRSLISSALYHVGFSAFSRLQEDTRALASGFSQATQFSCIIGFPMAFGLALLSDHVIYALYGPKWEASVVILSILAFQLVPGFFSMFVSACYRARGRADWVLYITIVDMAVTVVGILAVSDWPVWGVAALWVGKSMAEMPVHAYLLHRLLDVSFERMMRPTYLPLGASLIMGVFVYALDQSLGTSFGKLAELAAIVPAGIGIYWVTVWVMAPDLQRVAVTMLRSLASARGKAG